MRLKKAAVLASAALCLMGCSSDIVYSDSQTIYRAEWTVGNSLTFNAPTEAGTYSIDVLLRSTSQYEFQNIWLFVDTQIGDSILQTDTIEGRLSDNFGRRLGQGIGSTLTDYVSLHDSIALADTTYRFTVRHGMRVDTLQGISDVGITIRERIPE